MLKLLVLLFSLSVRTANEPEVPLDYEFKGGVKQGNNTVSFLLEQENGTRYRGEDIKLQHRILNLVAIEFRHYSRTAKNIDNQSVALLKGWKHLSVGVSMGLQGWKEPEGLAVLKYKRKFVSVRYSANKRNQYFDGDFSYEIQVTKRVSISPLVVVRNYNEKLFWQGKVQVEVKL